MSAVISSLSPNTQGILWGLLASALFAVVLVLAKVAAIDYHVLQILFFRQLVVFLSCLPSIANNYPKNLRTTYPTLHAIRLIASFIALSFSLWAVTLLPLTTAITLSFAQVFFITLLALFFLKEKVGIHRLGAVAMGFIGVVIVMRPGVEGFLHIHALVPLIGALAAGVAMTTVRKLSQTESTATLLVYQSTFVGLLAGLSLLWLWKTPDLQGWFLLFAMGILATSGQWIGVKALRLGEVSVVGHVQYTQLIYAAFLGFLLFDEVPDLYTLIGAAIIISSSIYIVYREKIVREKTVVQKP